MNSGEIIEDVFASQQAQQHPAYGLQMPQPLKQSHHLNTTFTAPNNTIAAMNYHQPDNASPYTYQLNNSVAASQNNFAINAPNNTKASFNQYGNNDWSKNTLQIQGAIRGRVAAPHVYDWNAPQSNEPEQKQDYGLMSGMKRSQALYSLDSYRFSPIDTLRQAIANLYAGATMTKTHQLGVYSIYKCPVENLTSGQYKYIVAVVPNHDYVQLGGLHTLSSLPWISFQTRSTDNPAKEFGTNRPVAVTYKIPNDSKLPIFSEINKVMDEPTKHVYLSKVLPVKVEVLKQKQGEMIADKSMLLSALESFRCVLTLTQQ
jgi:hypothetical protein